MSATLVQNCVGQRLLVSVSDGPPQMTCVCALSPRGQYVWLRHLADGDDEVGWQHVSRVSVLEVLGAATEPSTTLQTRLDAAIGVSAPLLTISTT